MQSRSQKRLVFALWSIEMLLGIAMIALGYAYYHNAACGCPAEITGRPIYICSCVNPAAQLSVWVGMAFTIIGAVGFALSMYRGAHPRKRR